MVVEGDPGGGKLGSEVQGVGGPASEDLAKGHLTCSQTMHGTGFICTPKTSFT